MAGGKSVWGIDLGQCAFKAIKLSFDPKQDRAIVEAVDFIEHPKILSQPDADPEELVRSAIEKFLSRNSVEGSKVFISVPGQAGLAKFVKLPPVEAKKIPDIVKFEASQQIPFPLEAVAWDFQALGTSQEEAGFLTDAEVGIFAIKRDIAGRHLAPFMQAKIEVETVQLAPLALYNCFAFDYFVHAAKHRGEAGEEGLEDEGDTLVILDIGAERTDVVITDGDTIYMRPINIGGNKFTRALSSELKLTFAKAEHLKRNATKAADMPKLFKAMQPVFAEFAGEITKSIQYYLSTHRNSSVRKVLGVGNGFKLPGLQKFLEKALQYKVEKVGRFYGMGGDVATEPVLVENMPSFCVAYGLALQGLEQTPIQTNLLPGDIRVARMMKRKKPWVLAASTMVLMAFTSQFVFEYRALSAVTAEEFKGPTSSATAAANQFNSYKSAFESAKSKFEASRKAGETTLGIEDVRLRSAWLQLFHVLNNALPPRQEIADGSQVEPNEVPEVNIESIDAIYFNDLGEWFGKIEERTKDSMGQFADTDGSVKKDRDMPPSGPGWVVQMLGFTLHREADMFVTSNLLHQKLHTDQFRKLGISHVIVKYQHEPQWSESKGTRIRTWDRPTPTSRLGGTAQAPTSFAPLPAGQNKQKVAGERVIERTDFAIQFVWKPKALDLPTTQLEPPPEVPTETVPPETVPADPGAQPEPAEANPADPGVQPDPAAPPPAAENASNPEAPKEEHSVPEPEPSPDVPVETPGTPGEPAAPAEPTPPEPAPAPPPG